MTSGSRLSLPLAPGLVRVLMALVYLVGVLLAAAFTLGGFGLAFGDNRITLDSNVGNKQIFTNSTPTETVLLAIGIALMVIAIPAGLTFLHRFLRELRKKAWLDGSKLSVRSVVRTHSVDLGKAQAVFGPGEKSIIATEPGSRASVKLPLKRLNSSHRLKLSEVTAEKHVSERLRGM